MNWETAKQSTLRVWRDIYQAIDDPDPLALLIEINAITDMCALAKEEATGHGDLARCHYCPAYQEFGGCAEVTAALSELVARREWPELRSRIAAFIDQLETLELPAAAQPAS